MIQYRWSANKTSCWRGKRCAKPLFNSALVSSIRQKIVTAASELARNAVVYGGGGRLELEIVAENGRQGLRLTISDEGKGIEDLTLAMKDGWTTGTGLGMGLPGTKRLVNEFRITSQPGVGTTVIVTRWK